MTRIGPYTLHVVEAGRFALDGGAMFGIVPKPLWERRIQADARNRIPLAMRCLLLEAADRLILIDNGLGDKYDARFADLYAVDAAAPTLHDSLKSAGFGADDVTDVILTHLHFDHCGGSTRRVGDRYEVVFENAAFHVQRRHWEWASAPNLRERASFLPENLEPLAASGRLVLHEGSGTPFDGVETLIVDGHTEAQQLVKVSGPEGTLVFAADLLPTTAHVPPVWIMGYDVRPLVTLAEKEPFLAEAAASGWTIFFEHDPVVETAKVAETEKGFAAVDPGPLAR